MKKIKKTKKYKIESLGVQTKYVYDIEVLETHNFIANNILVHNSNYLTLNNLVKKVGLENASQEEITDFLVNACEKIQEEIANEYNRLADMTNAKAQRMDMEREVIAPRGFWTRKKRYALNVVDSEGVRYDEPKLKIMGLETARSSTPKICREALKEAIELILTSDEDSVIKHINEFKEYFFQQPPEKIANTTGISNIEKFITHDGSIQKGTPIHVRGSLVYNKWIDEYKVNHIYEKIRSGDKVKNIYLKMPNVMKQNTVSFLNKIPKEMKIDDCIDYHQQYEKTFLRPLKTILDCIGWKSEKKNTLF